MHTVSHLEILPDLRSFISASPIFLQWFHTYRQPVLKPIAELLKAVYHDDESFTYDGIRGVQLRLRGHRFPYLDPYEVEVRTYWVDVSNPLSEKVWSGSLPFLCELFKQRQDADALISEFAVEAWNKLLGEARVRAQRDPSFTWLPEFDQPLVLSPSEIIRFEQGFLSYDHERHDIYHDLDRLVSTVRPEMSRPAWDHRPSDLEGFKEIGWCLRSFESVFHFVFGKYRELMYRVDRELLERDTLNSGISRGVETRVCQFLKRTKYQEHRCLIFLSIQGYGLLRNLRRIDEAHVRHFILNTFLWVILRDATGYLPLEYTFMRDIDQYGLLIDTPLKPMYEPWTRERYFWDRERMVKIYGNQQ
ncbi:hypothetical protein FGLOB1_388 [Fusarium globosum]|uniref:Uncharacterized protein n=1 Tax=Fusarium globosum TaxID=78864 RepID=A0A8H5YZ19_9HYPO|nr:hypothetical protein FGLOB1_388 [Fusarium globosum]